MEKLLAIIQLIKGTVKAIGYLKKKWPYLKTQIVKANHWAAQESTLRVSITVTPALILRHSFLSILFIAFVGVFILSSLIFTSDILRGYPINLALLKSSGIFIAANVPAGIFTWFLLTSKTQYGS